jgi:hypothetical protein
MNNLKKINIVVRRCPEEEFNPYDEDEWVHYPEIRYASKKYEEEYDENYPFSEYGCILDGQSPSELTEREYSSLTQIIIKSRYPIINEGETHDASVCMCSSCIYKDKLGDSRGWVIVSQETNDIIVTGNETEINMALVEF